MHSIESPSMPIIPEWTSTKARGRVVAIYGGPGTGKSTLAAALYSELKRRHVNVEYVNEFAKEMVYENNHTVLANQILVFAMQYHKLLTACAHNDVVITDSPLLLSCVYNPDTSHNLYELVVEMSGKFHNFDILLQRPDTTYQQSGRTHSLTESIGIDHRIRELLELLEIDFLEYNAIVDSNAFGALVSLISLEFDL